MADETELAIKQNEEQAAKLSIQARAEDKQVVDSAPAIWWFTSAAEGEIADYWSEQRDRDLRKFVQRPGNDILAGAVSSMTKKFQSMNWVIEGPERVVKKYQTMLAEAEFGAGWSTLIAKTVQDFCISDKGAFWELIGAGKADGPMTGPVLGVAHLDSTLCALTGDLEFPVLFRDPKRGKTHKLHNTRVIHFVDLESPDQSLNGIGFSAVSRVIASSQVLLKLAQYKNEKLSDLPEAGMLIMSNIPKHQYDDARANYQRERRRLGEELWAPIMVLFGLDPTQKATAEFISFATLPDAFNEKEATDLYVNIVALAFGVDTREFWPMSAGPLGTAAETLVQHQKAQGKGVGSFISQIERAVNWAILPDSVHFRFDYQDDAEDAERANIVQTKATTIMGMWTNGQDPLGGDPVVSRDEVRQMLADEVPYFNEEWLNPLEEDEEEEATDTEQEEKWYRLALDEWGPVIALDSKGYRVRGKSKTRKKPWMREPSTDNKMADVVSERPFRDSVTVGGKKRLGNAKVVTMKTRSTGRMWYSYDIEFDKPVGIEGDGENDWDIGDDAVYSISVPLDADTPDGLKKARERVARSFDHEVLLEKQVEPLKPKGKPLRPWGNKPVPITAEDLIAAIGDWDKANPDAVGLLRASVLE